MKTAPKKSAALEISRAAVGRQAGIARLTLLIFAPIVIAAIYTANQVGPFYYNYFELRNQMRSLIDVASVHTDEELLDKLETHMKWMQIPASIEDVRIRRYANSMEITLEYEETFWFSWGDEDYEIYTFEFNATEEGNF